MENNEGLLYTELYDVIHVQNNEDHLAVDHNEDVVEEEEEYDDEEEEEYDEEDGEEESQGEEDLHSYTESRVSVETGSVAVTTSSPGGDEGRKEKEEEESGDGVEEWNRSEKDGAICPICMEAWSTCGAHQVCCLACGHIYGMSCIKKWLERSKSSGRCPQCNRKSALKDIRVLYASRIVAVDGKLEKKIRFLEAMFASLEFKQAVSGSGSSGAGGSLGGEGMTNDNVMDYLRKLMAKMDAIETHCNARFDYFEGQLHEMRGRLGFLEGRVGDAEGLISETLGEEDGLI